MLFYKIIDEYINFQSDNEKIVIFYLFLKKYYRGIHLENINQDILNEFIYLGLPKVINKFNKEDLLSIVYELENIQKYLIKNYNIELNFKLKQAINEVLRLYDINCEFKKFLKFPVVSTVPLIIDINYFKTVKEKKALNIPQEFKEKGYFVFTEIFSNNSALLKNLRTNKFIRVYLNEKLLSKMKINDILFASIYKNFLFSWEFENIPICYPQMSKKFIKV